MCPWPIVSAQYLIPVKILYKIYGKNMQCTPIILFFEKQYTYLINLCASPGSSPPSSLPNSNHHPEFDVHICFCFLKKPCLGHLDSSVSLVSILDFGSVHDLRIMRSSPVLGSMPSVEPAWDSLSPFPSPPPDCARSLSLSLSNK